ncbi:MAG: hypothetical protein FWE32_11635 [Oscillospiraceae bacterium]|nr:hypothetical protein [Oscillospiraceae bacterium]
MIMAAIAVFAAVFIAGCGGDAAELPAPAPGEPATQLVPMPESTQESELEQESVLESENPLAPESWSAHFAALVEQLAKDEGARFWGIRGIHLFDMTGDGVPNLLVEVGLEMGAGPFLFVAGWDEVWETFTMDDLAFSGFPLRFFESDQTGRVIYSSLVFDHFSRGIIYRDTKSAAPFRAVFCSGAVDHHILREWTGTDWETIEEFETTQEYQDPNGCGCDIQFGRSSSHPTIVHLVNLALEGFAEIPAPPVYSFDGLGDVPTFFIQEYAPEVQAWIFEVAENWGG